MNPHSQTVVVPAEPTKAMHDAYLQAETGDDWETAFRNGYKAMIAAAPQPSGPEGGVTPAMLEEACIIGLAVAGSIPSEGWGDDWLRNHENRLRTLEKIARQCATAHSSGGQDG